MDVVLCHEDALVRDVIRTSLEDQGFEVANAASVDEVRELAREPVSCIVSYGLLDGVDQIREHLVGAPDTHEHRIIVLASRNSETVAALDRGADACVGPSEGLERLVRVLRHDDRGAIAAAEAARAKVLVRETARSAAPDLTPRETEVLTRLVRGDSTRRLADHLGVSPATARTHVQNVLVKLGVHSRLQAVAFAVDNQLVSSSMLDEDSEETPEEATA